MSGFENTRLRHVFVVSLLLLLATLAIFWQVARHDFINFDDDEYITNNPPVRAGLNGESLVWAFTAVHSANWHPLTWISHMLDCSLYGLDPAGHHVTNLLLHIVNVLLLFLILTRMTGLVWRSACVAALFALHPLHVESVAWLSGRKDVLSTLFWLLTVWAYVRYVEQPGVKRYLPVVLLLAVGLTAKPMLVTLPFVLLLLDYWPLGRFAPRAAKARKQGWAGWKLVWEKAPLFALSLASSIVTCFAQRKCETVWSLERFPLGVRAANAIVAYAAYIVKTIWPRGLAFFYPHPKDAIPTWEVIGAGLLLAAACFLVWRGRQRHPYLAVGWLWYLGTLVPVIGLVQVGWQAMADRYTYVPLIGIFIIAAWGIPDALLQPSRARLRRSEVTALGAAAVVCISALMTATWAQVGHWRNCITLYEHALKVTKDNHQAHVNLGDALALQGKLEEAIVHYSEAARIEPSHANTHNNLGIALAKLGRIDEAIEEYREAIRLKPDLAQAHNNLGIALAAQGGIDEAIGEYRKAIRLKPNFAEAHDSLGLALVQMGRLDEGIEECREAVRIRPDNAEAHSNLGLALETQGRIDEAIREYREAIRLKPDLAQAHNNLGLLFAKHKRLDEAIEEFRAAVSADPRFAQAHNNLAAAFFDKGNYAEAWREIEECRKCGVSPHPGLVEALLRKMPVPPE